MADAQSELVLLERRDSGVAVLTLNRPGARNALSRQLAAELKTAVSLLAVDERVRVVIITGTGDRAFCAGADLIERQTMTAAGRTAHTEQISVAFDDIAALPVPVIAAIRGYALAGGAELALACDLRIGASDAVFGFPEVKIGIFPGAGGVVRLPRLVGASAANDLLFTGRQIDAGAALRIGLLDAVVAPETALATAVAKAMEIAANAPLAIRALKRALRASAGMPSAGGAEIVRSERRSLDLTEDYEEGLAAFAQKRAPAFNGR